MPFDRHVVLCRFEGRCDAWRFATRDDSEVFYGGMRTLPPADLHGLSITDDAPFDDETLAVMVRRHYPQYAGCPVTINRP